MKLNVEAHEHELGHQDSLINGGILAHHVTHWNRPYGRTFMKII